MSAPTIPNAARQAKNTINSILKASDAATAPVKKPTHRFEHGQRIFVFKHLQKNNVVYSFTKALNNNASLKQLPYNGKKTVPSALRKDLWHPFAQISFRDGKGSIGLSVYQKLREYRRRHELEWGDEIAKDEKGKLRKRVERGRLLCDQKANSIADMAAVLSMLDKSSEEGGKAEEAIEGDTQKAIERPKRPSIGLEGEGTGEEVEILWKDLTDAEFAESWGSNIQHGVIDMESFRETEKEKLTREKRARGLQQIEQIRLLKEEKKRLRKEAEKEERARQRARQREEYLRQGAEARAARRVALRLPPIDVQK